MGLLSLGSTTLSAVALSASFAIAQPAVDIDGDDITMRGCVTPSSAQLQMPFETLMWSRSGILTAGTAAADVPVRAGAAELASRVLHWIDDDALEGHVGQMVELRGELEGLETGELEIDRDGDFTEIRLELDGDEETVRVPTAWLERPSVARASRNADRDDIEIEIATRKVDVKEVKRLGPCPGR
jgi:hypothetical protein